MSFLSKLFGRTSSEKEVIRQAKPLSVNLGDVQDFVLESIVERDTPLQMAIQKTGAEGLTGMENAIITPDLARQALRAKRHEHEADNLVRSGKYEEAIGEYKSAIDLAPYEDEIVFMSIGAVLDALGRDEECLRYLEIAHEINPLNDRVARNLQKARKKAGL